MISKAGLYPSVPKEEFHCTLIKQEKGSGVQKMVEECTFGQLSIEGIIQQSLVGLGWSSR